MTVPTAAEATEAPTEAGTIPAEVVEEITPATTEVPVEAPVEEAPGEPLTRDEARRQLQEDRAKERESAQETTEEPEGETTDSAAATPEAKTEEKSEEAEPAKAIQIPIGDEHPVRKMGLESLTAKTEHEERVIRALLNGTYARRQDLASAQSEASNLREQLTEEREKRFREEAEKTVKTSWRSTPEYKQCYEKYQEITENVGPEEAAIYWKGVEADLKGLTDTEYKQRVDAQAAEDNQRQAQTFGQDAWRKANELPEHIRTLPGFRGWFEEAIADFGVAMSNGRYDHIDQIADPVERTEKLHNEFRAQLGSRLVREKEVGAAYQRIKNEQEVKDKDASAATEAAERDRKAIEDAAVEKFKKTIADNRTTTPPHPLGNLGTGVPRTSDSQGSEGDGKPSPNQSVHEIRREQKMAARNDTRRRFNSP